MQGYADNFIPVILSGDDVLHTTEHPFCPDEICFCHEDQELLTTVSVAVTDGLFTSDEATTFIQGRTV